MKKSMVFVLLLALASLGAGRAGAQVSGAPRIASIRVDPKGARVTVVVPAGVRRLVLESTRRGRPEGWEPRVVRRLDGVETRLEIDVPADAAYEMLRVRADAADPLAEGFYAGKTNIPPVPLAGGGPAVFRGGEVVSLNDVPTVDAGGGGAERAVVESDIWKLAGDRLYFFNQFRGFQVLDVSRPDEPRLLGTLSYPSAGEQLYVPDSRHVVLLLREDCRGNGFNGAAIAVVDVAGGVPREVGRLPVAGRIFESRMVGSALYVASQTYENTDPARGVWEQSTVVSSFDLADPAKPVARDTRRVPGAATVVTAAANFFFVGLDASQSGQPRRGTDLHVLDVSAPDGTVAPFATVRLTGYLRDKFKLNLQGDVLRVVMEDQETADRWSPITRLTTWRLARDGAANYQALGRMDLGPGENLFGTRFDGDRAYVVTYRRIDPLWIVDLSDPTRPALLGELHIPGWSNYLHPMGDRLLTVGIDDTEGWRAAVQLFDVSNPAKPALLSKVPLGDAWSSSEANWDEKALGVFPEAGTVLIPFSGSTKEGYRQGVQLIDLGRDALKARGVIEHETFTPRRSAIVGPRVLSLSSRELLTTDIADRDAPHVVARLALSRPVDRVLVSGEHLLTFGGTELQVAERGAPDAVVGRVDLGKYPVLGAARSADRLYVMQGLSATVSWEADASGQNGVTVTNSGVVLMRTFSLASLPKVEELGSVEEKHDVTYLGEVQALWPNATTLVWATEAVQGYFGPWLYLAAARPAAVTDVIGVSDFAGRGLWYPGRWGWGQPRALFAFDVTDVSRPAHRSTFVSRSAATGASEAFSGDGLVLFSEQFQESTVTGTNEVVWTESYYVEVPDPTLPDGKPRPVLMQRQVTNQIPIVQWWQRHELRVVDYSAGGRDPVVRPALAFPGELRGVGQGGSLLYSLASRTESSTNTLTRQILEVSAYDGVAVYVGEGQTLTRDGEGQARVHVAPSGHVVATLASWQATPDHRLRVYGLEGTRWSRVADVALSEAPQESVLRGSTLIVRGAGTTSLWDLTAPEAPRSVPSVDHGCIWYQLTRVEGGPSTGWWVPGGEYGVLHLGPR